MTYSDSYSPTNHLPDPLRQPAFYASVPTKRFFAWVVDSLLILILVVIAIPLTGFLGLFILFPLYVTVGFVYRVVTLTGGSATLGMRLMAIEIRRANGQKLDLSTASLHTLGFTLCFSFFILQIISGVLMVTTDKGQSLTDHVLGTVALNRRK
ncbi:MAG: RDD family protein [Paracoccaceae bacterium]